MSDIRDILTEDIEVSLFQNPLLALSAYFSCISDEQVGYTLCHHMRHIIHLHTFTIYTFTSQYNVGTMVLMLSRCRVYCWTWTWLRCSR